MTLSFQLDSQNQVVLDLSNPPPWLARLVIYLPGGHMLTHNFTDLPPPPPLPLPAVSLLYAAFLDHLEIKEGASPHTLTGYRRRLGQFLRWLDAHPAQTPADPATWLAYYATLKRHRPEYAANTMRNHYDALRRFGRFLHEQGHLTGLPLADVERPADKAKSEPRAIERSHINAMLKAASDPRDQALLLFFRDTACRADEALQLTWEKIKWTERKAEVIGKGDKARQLFFKPLTRRALERYRDSLPLARRRPDDPIWWGKKGPLNYSGLYKIFERLASAAGLDGEIFNPHAWRHAFGRDATVAGIPTAQLQELMGHNDIATTKIYAQFNTLELQQAHDRYSPINGDL